MNIILLLLVLALCVETKRCLGATPKVNVSLLLYTFTFGSFSAVSTPPIARVVAFSSIFCDLQDVHSFAPLQYWKFSKISSFFFADFCGNFAFSPSILSFFRTDFHENSSKFRENSQKMTRCREILLKTTMRNPHMPEFPE